MYANCVLWPHRERSDNVLEMQVSTLGKLGSYAEDNLYYNLTYLTPLSLPWHKRKSLPRDSRGFEPLDGYFLKKKEESGEFNQ